MSWVVVVSGLLLMLGSLVFGCCVGWGVCVSRFDALAAQLARERAALNAERESARKHVAIVERAAAEAIDTIDAMKGLAQVEALLARREPVR